MKTRCAGDSGGRAESLKSAISIVMTESAQKRVRSVLMNDKGSGVSPVGRGPGRGGKRRGKRQHAPPVRDIRQKSLLRVVLARYLRHFRLRRPINTSFFIDFEARKGSKKRPFRVSAWFSAIFRLLARLLALLTLVLF